MDTNFHESRSSSLRTLGLVCISVYSWLVFPIVAAADYPTLFRFDTSKERAFALFTSSPASGEVIPEMTNAQKLSLPANTTIGTKVKVSDAFVVSGGDDDTNGFYYDTGTMENGKEKYKLVGKDADHFCSYTGTRWSFNFSSINAVIGSEANPWLANFSGGGLTLTHPALQQLASPSIAQGGVFVSGGTQDGVNTARGTANDRPYYNLLGEADDPDNSSLSRNITGLYPQWAIFSPNNNSLFESYVYESTEIQVPGTVGNATSFMVRAGGSGHDANIIFINSITLSNSSVTADTEADSNMEIGFSDAPTPSQIASKIAQLTNTFAHSRYTATSSSDRFFLIATNFNDFGPAVTTNTANLVVIGTNVVQDSSATPDLVPQWVDMANDPPILFPLSVSSILKGELDAGLTRSGVVYSVTGNQNGRNLFHDVLGVAADIGWDGTQWTNGTNNGSGNTASPWSASLGSRNDVAAEANWSIVP